jgi:diguanylate cyclase (GGDEF)-like protein/PAS domain S-box-containing protein
VVLRLDDSSARPGPGDRAAFQNVAARLSRVLGAAESATLDTAVETCLEDLGRFARVDVAFATLVDEDEQVSADWHWICPGRVARAPELGTPLAATFGSATEFLRLGHTLLVEDLLGIDLAPSERALATANGLRAILISPVRLGSELLGVVGLQIFDRPHAWGDAIASQVEAFAEVIVKAVIRCRERGALAIANARARRIAESIPDGLLLLGTDGIVSWVSPSLERIRQAAAEEIVGRPVDSLFHPSHHRELRAHLAAARINHEAHIAAQLRTGESQWRWTDVALRLASDPESGVPDEIVMIVHDSHDRHLRETELAERTERDPLTGLLNRSGFERRIATLAERPESLAIAFCDIDDFKEINDSFGHQLGDEVLQAVAEALESSLREGDLVARIGGDEFAVAAKGMHSPDEVEAFGERLVESVRSVTTAANIAVSISVGICGPGRASQAADMRHAADKAMYHAKRAGKNASVHSVR